MYVGRRYDGRLQWIQNRDARENAAQTEVLGEGRYLGDIPSFPEIERLLAIYVATGEGKGAYIAAKVAEEQNPNYETRKENRGSRRFSRYSRPPRHSGYSSSSSSDDDDAAGNAPGPPLRPSGGRPPGGAPQVVEIPQRPRPPRPVHIVAEEDDEPVIIIEPPVDPGRLYGLPAEHLRPRPEFRMGQNRPHAVFESDESSEPDYAPIPSEEDDIRLSNQRTRSRSFRRQQSSHSHGRHRPHRHRSANIEIVGLDDTGLGARAFQGERPNLAEHRQRYEIRRDPAGRAFPRERPNPTEHRQRFDVHRDQAERSTRRSMRYRAGGPLMNAPTKTAGIGAGVLVPGVHGTEPKPIILHFFCVNRGKIFSSRRREAYTTFQELGRNKKLVVDQQQQSDQWLVDKLHEHYFLIKRRYQGLLWELLHLRTIGFATFLRFERTVRQDPNGFAVTAKVPAISAQGEAISQFRYLLSYPFESAKMMLYNLDRLAASTEEKRDRHCFYVVEIKETVNTKKIYIILTLLVLISTGGGTAYAVIYSDLATGLAIATYVLTCLALIVSFVAAGQYLGLSKPDSFSFAYSLEENQIIGATNVDRIFDLE